jgi:midasin (ATPase involved in ribosome maturation)
LNYYNTFHFSLFTNSKFIVHNSYNFTHGIYFSLDEIEDVAQSVVAENPEKLFFFGEMGAGKTTFIKQLAKELGVTELQVAFLLMNTIY